MMRVALDRARFPPLLRILLLSPPLFILLLSLKPRSLAPLSWLGSPSLKNKLRPLLRIKIPHQHLQIFDLSLSLLPLLLLWGVIQSQSSPFRRSLRLHLLVVKARMWTPRLCDWTSMSSKMVMMPLSPAKLPLLPQPTTRLR
eukprot:TRINITY_DN4853_c0_g1::TRINITY_DN4853_c0_g1_i1::g.978::m.978 TRINITY_DN4853_c0_g1::TRINITY_DN4853_c0_g1_i1::g.978  ORF type:complete len:142 (-),score=-5.58,Lectin_N/PF03954.9/1.4e+03,Lectin_N/PF03954.9/0.035 TRINITY_DN4853_c0_g1_i1:596-1021(-)